MQSVSRASAAQWRNMALAAGQLALLNISVAAAKTKLAAGSLSSGGAKWLQLASAASAAKRWRHI